jgi:penicillin-binding protein 2
MNPNARVVIAGIFTVVLFIYLIRLFYVQVMTDKYKLSANNNVIRYVTEYPARGLIYDRNGELMVYNEAVYDLMVIPRQVKALDTAEFCRLVDISKEEFIRRMQKAKKYSRYKSSVFEKQIPSEQYAMLQEKLYKFNGFYVQPRTLRKYPTRSAAHALGYIGEVDEKQIARDPYYQMGDYIGISGIEQSYEKELRGKRGVRIVMVDVHNREKGSFEDGRYDSASVAGEDIMLTLDAKLQAYAEALMQNKAGGVAAIEPGTGEILALLSSPSYDPNLMVGKARNKNYALLATDPYKSLFNRAMMAYYPPGSTFKLASAASAVNEQIIGEHTTYPHVFTVGSKSVKCHPHPPVALEGAIQYSCNPYFCNVFRSFVDNKKYGTSENGYRVWREYIMSFGVGKKIGVDMPHELPGLLPPPEYYDKIYGKGKWKASTIYSLGIGQGELGITPLQMANITCVIANRGFYYTPHIVKAISGKPNTTRNLSEKHFCKVAPGSFNIIIDGMQKVVESGTARIAKFGNTVICGKTGTAQNPHGKDHSLFVAFAPRDNPKIAVAVMVENSGFGATWAAPIASLMMELYLTDTITRPELEKRIMEGDLLKDYPLPGTKIKAPVPPVKRDTAWQETESIVVDATGTNRQN